MGASRPAMNNSNRSVSPGLLRCHLARGDIIAGWLIINVGFTQFTSIKSPQSLSKSLAVVCGGLHSTSLSAHNFTRNSLVSSLSKSVGIETYYQKKRKKKKKK